MKEIVERLQERRNIEVAKSILESAGYSISKKINESKKMKWTFNGDDMYFLTDYDDEGNGDLPIISEEDGVYTAMISGNDYKGKSFDDIDQAIKYVEDNIDKEALEQYYDPGVHEYDGESY